MVDLDLGHRSHYLLNSHLHNFFLELDVNVGVGTVSKYWSSDSSFFSFTSSFFNLSSFLFFLSCSTLFTPTILPSRLGFCCIKNILSSSSTFDDVRTWAISNKFFKSSLKFFSLLLNFTMAYVVFYRCPPTFRVTFSFFWYNVISPLLKFELYPKKEKLL